MIAMVIPSHFDEQAVRLYSDMAGAPIDFFPTVEAARQWLDAFN